MEVYVDDLLIYQGILRQAQEEKGERSMGIWSAGEVGEVGEVGGVGGVGRSKNQGVSEPFFVNFRHPVPAPHLPKYSMLSGIIDDMECNPCYS